MDNFKLIIKIALSCIIVFISIIFIGTLLGKEACKQRAEAYNMSYIYKFPAGCMIGIRK